MPERTHGEHQEKYPHSRLLARASLIAVVRGAVGTDMFRSLYVAGGSGPMDVLEDGRLSCAFFVSSVLNAVVEKTIAKMGEAGWVLAEVASLGCVTRWPILDSNEHIGFCVANDTFVSNSSSLRSPQIHGSSLPDGREPIAYYRHPVLDD